MKLFLHRGGAGLRVENSLAAFAHGIDLGADGAELDVHLSRDGEVVVHHDERLNGAYCRDESGRWLTAEQAVPIASLTWAQLQRYEIGIPDPASAYAREFDRIQPVPGQRIPSLRDVMRLAKSRSERFVLVIEIKSPLQQAGAPWRALVDATLAVIADENFADRSILCSFVWPSLLHARQRWPDLPTWFTSLPGSWLGDGRPPPQDHPPEADELEAIRTRCRDGDATWFGGFDPRRFAGGYPDAIAAAGGSAWFMYHRDCTRKAHLAAQHFGLESAAWSANLRDQRELARLAGTGVDNLVADYPDILAGWLSRA